MEAIHLNLGNTNPLSNGCHTLSGNVKIYIKNGLKHRDAGPAEIHPNGLQVWFKEGKRHRDGGLPAVVHPDGREEYWVNGKKVLKPKQAPKK